jgi:acyl dehydratase
MTGVGVDPVSTSSDPVVDGLPIGEVAYSRGRTITDGEFGLLTSLTWTIGPMHVDDEFMKTTQFGARVLGGPIVAAVVSGLWYTSCWEDFRRTYRVRPIGALGLEARNRGPVYAGDTLRVQTTLAEARASKSKPGCGLLVFADEAFNQRDELIITMRRTLMFERMLAAPTAS